MNQASRLARALVACAALAVVPPVFAQTIPDAPAGRELDPALTRRFGVLSLLRPCKDAIMGFQQPTKVAAVPIRGGQEVMKGQVIVKGDDAEEDALLRIQAVRARTTLPVDRARAAMNQAEHESNMMHEAKAKGAAGDQEVRRADLNHTVARLDFENAELQQAQEVIQYDRMKARVDRYRIEAPFDGIVDLVMADLGQSVGESDKLVRVVNIDQLWIDVGARIDDPLTLRLKEFDPAWVLLDVAGEARLCRGKVIEVSPTADLSSRTRRIRVEIENPKGPQRVIAGGPAWVRFSPPPNDLLDELKVHADQRAMLAPRN